MAPALNLVPALIPVIPSLPRVILFLSTATRGGRLRASQPPVGRLLPAEVLPPPPAMAPPGLNGGETLTQSSTFLLQKGQKVAGMRELSRTANGITAHTFHASNANIPSPWIHRTRSNYLRLPLTSPKSLSLFFFIIQKLFNISASLSDKLNEISLQRPL